MKTTKQLTTTKTPIDIKRRLDLASRGLLEAVRLLGSLDQTSFPPSFLHEAATHAGLALAAVAQLDAHRPLKKTERRAPAPEAAPAPAAEAPAGEVFFVMEDGRLEVAPEPSASAPAAEPQPEPEPVPSVEELRRQRKRERDRASAARRRAAAAS